MSRKEKRISRWYFGGLASTGAAMCTHPLDLIKVHLQTQQTGKSSIIQIATNVVKKNGILALYAGLTASMVRQLTYSTTRFAIYEALRRRVKSDSFFAKVTIATIAGAAGGFVGTPSDLVNVRMQNDLKLPPEKRKNYKHALDGMIRVYKEEGLKKSFAGASTATSRSVFMTIGQIAFYDQVKSLMLSTSIFKDNTTTHFLASSAAGVMCTLMTQPVDTIKTRMMSNTPRAYTGLWDCISFTGSAGPLAFYKGFFPSFVRILPNTILVFLIYEQLRINFGIDPP